jgi:hypothetical protein
MIQRTPASVARKLGNFGAFDPQLRERKITGLTHTSRLDKEVWDEFHKDWAGLVAHAQELRVSLDPGCRDETMVLPPGPSEKIAYAKTRLHQTFFRQAVLSSYNNVCCVTGLAIPECLVASHIVPWSVDECSRADPCNGLCLSATFDRLFDTGLMTVTPGLGISIAQSVKNLGDTASREMISARDGQQVILPMRFLPKPEYLLWHNHHVFKGA